MAILENFFSPRLDQNFEYERRFEFSDQSSRQYEETNIDARSFQNDSTYAPTLIFNSPNASASPTLKKESLQAPQITSTPTLSNSPQKSEARAEATDKSNFQVDSSLLLLIGAGVVAFVVLRD